MDYKGSLNTQASAAGCEIPAPLCSESPSHLDMKGLTGDCGGSWAGLCWTGMVPRLRALRAGQRGFESEVGAAQITAPEDQQDGAREPL